MLVFIVIILIPCSYEVEFRPLHILSKCSAIVHLQASAFGVRILQCNLG